MKLSSDILAKIEFSTGEKIESSTPVGGGCISDAQIISCKSGVSFFLKINSGYPGMFEKEANGLNELRKAGAIRVPEVIIADNEFILLENIKQASRNKNFFEAFGEKFANLHRFVSDNFGFYENNYLGSSPQINFPPGKDWKSFYWEKRILYQINLSRRNGFEDKELLSGISKLEEKLDDILQDSEYTPCLLHGDLWSGNYIADEDGDACLIDPAVYYGNREADMAMTKLFGGFTPEFYRSYNENFPLPDGYEYRENFYKLYHLLNHLNIFGRGYYPQVINAIKFYL